MARSELIRDFEALMEKIKTQKDILMNKVASVDYLKAVSDESIYESFMPTIEVLQDDLDKMQTSIFSELQDICLKLMTMYDEIDKVSPEPDTEEQEEVDTVEDEEFSAEEIAQYEKEAEEAEGNTSVE